MIYYNKIGLLILNEGQTKFLVCEKDSRDVTADYIMPGGQFDEPDEITCLMNEIKEELNCDIDAGSLEYIGEYYSSQAAGRPDRGVNIKLYKGRIMGVPIPSSEIKKIHWIGKEDQFNPKVSELIREKIIPDLVKRNILK